MATRLYVRNFIADFQRCTNEAKLNGVASTWRSDLMFTSAGSGVVTSTTPTVAGATNGVEVVDATPRPFEWYSQPVSADVTISGAITGNIWAQESNMSANVAINFVVDKVDATTLAVTEIARSARTTELGTSRTVQNFTATPAAGVTLNKGDRLRLRIYGDDAGTMGSGFTFTIGYDGNTGGADGDTYIEFTETFSFLTSDPSTTEIYLTDTASDVATASVDKEAWTSRGGGATTKATNTAAGWTSGIQMTDGAGGTVIDWFTKQLQAFTLTGLCVASIRFLESNAAANASVRLEIARVDSDGSNPTIWSTGANAPNQHGSPGFGELDTSERLEFFRLAGDDLAFTDGQRIRIRLYLEDNSYNGPLVTGHTASVVYGGAASATGDSYLRFGQTLAEFVSSVSVPRHGFVNHGSTAIV